MEHDQITTVSTGISGGVIAIFVLIYVALLVVFVWAEVRIIRRSGYSGWWMLMALVPVANIVFFLMFAFREAPTERELKQLRAWAAQSGPNYGGYPGGYGGQPGGYGGYPGGAGGWPGA